MNKTIDARGKQCPIPVVEAKKAAETYTEDGTLTVLVDNSIAVSNLRKLAGKLGYEVNSTQTSENEFEVTMQVVTKKAPSQATVQAPSKSVQPEESKDCIECEGDPIEKGLVIVLSSNQMGQGAEQLGKNLMKSFIYAVSKMEKLPETILCYNSGAYLTCEDSLSLSDFKDMEAEGVKIATCGTCLDFNGLKEKLAVGSVTNMYDIVEIMEAAKKIVKP